MKSKQGNRGDMRKIHVTPKFFKASGPLGDFFEKTKNPLLDMVTEILVNYIIPI